MTYVDGMVAAVPNDKKEAFIAFSKRMAPIFSDHGAIKQVDCWGDDVPDGKLTSFPMAVKREPDESIVFSWVIWPSKEARNAAFEKAMADPRMEEAGSDMPFDGKRMIFGGFEMIAEF